MARATADTTATRIDALAGMILAGSSNTTCVLDARQEWGLSRSQSYRLLKKAWMQIRNDVYEVAIDRQEMLCWCIHQLQAAAADGIKRGQGSVTVGAVRQLDVLLGLGAKSAGTPRQGCWR